MFEFSFLSDVINLYYMLPNDLAGPTDNMLDGGTLLKVTVQFERCFQLIEHLCYFVT